jgi:hypothetical protein
MSIAYHLTGGEARLAVVDGQGRLGQIYCQSPAGKSMIF